MPNEFGNMTSLKHKIWCYRITPYVVPAPGPKFFLFLVQVAGTLCIEGHFEKNFVGHFTAFSTVTNPENEIFVNIFHVFQTSLVSVLNIINLTKFLLKT